MELGGTYALVTGAGTGLGRAVAIGLAHAGAAGVAIHYNGSADGAEETASLVRQAGATATTLQTDLADAGAARGLAARAAEPHGRLDLLVNNAAMRYAIPFDDLDALTEEVWSTILAVNLLAPFHCAHGAADFLRQANGAIVNVASIAGLRGVGSSIPYGVAKAGLVQLTRSLAIALAPEVTVNAVAPGRIDTAAYGRLVGAEAIAQHDRETLDRTPSGHICSPEDVAQAVLALLTSRAVTGEVVVVDGGRSLLY